MKKIITVALIFLGALGFSQTSSDENFNFNQLEIKHIKGIKGIELNYGIGGNNGRYLQFMYDIYWRDKWMAGFGLNYENMTLGNTHINDFQLRHNSYWTIGNIKQKLYFNVTGGIFLGLEKIYPYTTADNSFSYPQTYKFLYGASAGGNIELYINTKTSITVTGEQYVSPNCPLGIWKFNLLGGIRIYFN